MQLRDLPTFVPAGRVAIQLGVGLAQLYAMSESGQFCRYYVFGKRRFYNLREVQDAIQALVPGNPDQWRRIRDAADAASPAKGRRPRRGAQRPARGSNAPAS